MLAPGDGQSGVGEQAPCGQGGRVATIAGHPDDLRGEKARVQEPGGIGAVDPLPRGDLLECGPLSVEKGRTEFEALEDELHEGRIGFRRGLAVRRARTSGARGRGRSPDGRD